MHIIVLSVTCCAFFYICVCVTITWMYMYMYRMVKYGPNIFLPAPTCIIIGCQNYIAMVYPS